MASKGISSVELVKLENMIFELNNFLIQGCCPNGLGKKIRGEISKLKRIIYRQTRNLKPINQSFRVTLNINFLNTLHSLRQEAASMIRKHQAKVDDDRLIDSLISQFGQDNVQIAERNVGRNPDVMHSYLMQFHPEA